VRRMRWPRRDTKTLPAAGSSKPGVHSPRGRIVAPAAGATVTGLVSVVVEPADTGRPVDAVRLEWGRGKSWTIAATLDERTYELDLPGGAAIVRSEELAEALGALFETTLEPSTLRPWPSRRELALPWDTSAIPLGPVGLRAITLDAAGDETATATVEIAIVPPGYVTETATALDTDPRQRGTNATESAQRLQPRARRSWAVLEAAIDSHPELDPWRRESLEALLHYLIGYAEPDGTIPEQFDSLVDEEFGSLLEVTW
jgi:hypothetical protein